MPRTRFRASTASLLLCILTSVACGHRSEGDGAAGVAPTPAPSAQAVPSSAALPASAEPAASATAAVAPVGGGATAEPSSGSSDGADFATQALTLFRVASCGKSGEVPARFDAKLVAGHCAALERLYERYRTRWLDVAMPFIAALRPKDLPPKVVYPFGGGDLVSALAVYPDAEEITTLSLEPAGDVRHIDTVLPIRLKGTFNVNDHNIGKLLGLSYSNTINLGRGDRAWLPGEIVLLLAALAVHGYEPTALRYFRFKVDGSLHYLSMAEVDAESRIEHPEPEGGRAPLANVEIRFRKPGVAGSDKVMRHVAHDLANHEVGLDPGLMRYLEGRGRVAVMTKAASHLLWSDDFSKIRDYLLEHAAWMISDSTGVPPRFATAAGFVQDTFGTFDGPAPFGPIEAIDGRAFRRLFAENPKRALPFKFGYGDVHHRHHMVVMRKPTEAAPAKQD